MADAGDEQRAQRITVRVGVVAEDARRRDGQRPVLGHAVAVVHRRRRLVDPDLEVVLHLAGRAEDPDEEHVAHQKARDAADAHLVGRGRHRPDRVGHAVAVQVVREPVAVRVPEEQR